MFTNSKEVGEQSEVRQMRHKVLRRIAATFVLAIFVLLMALHRVSIIKVDVNGLFGTVALLSALTAVLYIALDRDSYLPFLGECIVPTSVLASKVPSDASFTVTVNVPAGATHVMYWASESGSGVVASPYGAYGNYSNAGIVQASTDGTAALPLRCPSQYKVRGKTLPRHVHYRALYKSGIAGPVQTTNVTCA